MKYKVTIRNLNNLGNQLVNGSISQKKMHEVVLNAVNAKIDYVILDNEVEAEKTLLDEIEAARELEIMENIERRIR